MCECAGREGVRGEGVVDGHSDPVGSSSLDQVCDVGLEWQVTSTVTHHLHSIHPLHRETHMHVCRMYVPMICSMYLRQLYYCLFSF